MSSKEDLIVLATGKNSTYARAVRALLEEELAFVSDVDNANTEAELQGAKYSKQALRKILDRLEANPAQVDKKKTSYR